MKKLVFGLILVLIAPNAAAAQEEFNPSFVITDKDLVNVGTMDVDDIQNLLDAHNGALKSLRFFDIDNIQKSAAEIIYGAAQRSNINPRVLLVMLQKEMSLITDPSPSLSQLNWATGFAVCDSCDVSDPGIKKHMGFATQVDSTAALFRFYIENKRSHPWIKRALQEYKIDEKVVIPVNDATAFLYTYTPHLEGNKNFRTIWRRWFERDYPDGLLVKADQDPDVWYLERGKRRRVTSMSVLVSYFDENDIVTIDRADINMIDEGIPMSYENYSLLRQGIRTYLLVDEELLQFASQEAMRSLGFNPLEIIDVVPSEIAHYIIGTMITSASAYPTGALLQARNSTLTYYVKNGVKHELLSDGLLASNFNGEPPVVIDDDALADYFDGDPITFKDGSLIANIGDSKVYLISNGERRYIPDEQTFAQLGFSFDDVAWIGDTLFELHPEAEALQGAS